jgi:hypothetical protein
MPTLESIDPSILYCMFKGEPGTRKSTSALSFPTPQYWFSYDGKMESLLLPMRHWGLDPKEITYDDYNDWNGGRKKLEEFRLNCPYKTIVIDSITSVGDAINRQTLKLKSGTTKNDGGEAGKRIAGIPVNTIEDFNAETSALQELVALTKDIHKYHKINVVLIAHIIQTEQRTPDGKTHMSRLIVTGGKKIAAKMPAYCTEIYHFNIEGGFEVGKGGSYTILTAHTGDDFARTSLPLDGTITIGNDSLYDKYLVPAISKMKEKPKVVTKF